MKILIMYASAGAGHRRSAEAIYSYLKNNRGDCEVKIIDILDKTPQFFKQIYVLGYSFLVNRASWLWGLAFSFTSLKALSRLNNALNFFTGRLFAKPLAGFLIAQDADFVISTHFMASEICAYLKNSGRISSRLVTVITDYAVHPFWIYEGTDIYVVASEYAKEELLKQGVRQERIREYGIPVDEGFLRSHDRRLLAQKLGITADKFTALLVTGSFGLGPIEEIADALHDEIQLLVVCAKNKQLYQRLKNKGYSFVKVFGFVDNMQELMSCADIIITKPGGLTISEVLSVGLVPVFISAIPGQETNNALVLEKEGIGHSVKDVPALRSIILDYRAHPEKLSRMKEKIKLFAKPKAAEELASVIC